MIALPILDRWAIIAPCGRWAVVAAQGRRNAGVTVAVMASMACPQCLVAHETHEYHLFRTASGAAKRRGDQWSDAETRQYPIFRSQA